MNRRKTESRKYSECKIQHINQRTFFLKGSIYIDLGRSRNKKAYIKQQKYSN